MKNRLVKRKVVQKKEHKGTVMKPLNTLKVGSGAFSGKMLLERIIEKINKLMLIFGQVRLSKG